MTPELLNLYKECYKIGAYFIRWRKDNRLHLISIHQPSIYKTYEYEVPEVRRQLLLYLFGLEDLQPSLSQTELLLRELPIIQYQGKKPCSNLTEV